MGFDWSVAPERRNIHQAAPFALGTSGIIPPRRWRSAIFFRLNAGLTDFYGWLLSVGLRRGETDKNRRRVKMKRETGCIMEKKKTWKISRGAKKESRRVRPAAMHLKRTEKRWWTETHTHAHGFISYWGTLSMLGLHAFRQEVTTREEIIQNVFSVCVFIVCVALDLPV